VVPRNLLWSTILVSFQPPSPIAPGEKGKREKGKGKRVKRKRLKKISTILPFSFAAIFLHGNKP
jgi:hypothetical protein